MYLHGARGCTEDQGPPPAHAVASPCQSPAASFWAVAPGTAQGGHCTWGHRGVSCVGPSSVVHPTPLSGNRLAEEHSHSPNTSCLHFSQSQCLLWTSRSMPSASYLCLQKGEKSICVSHRRMELIIERIPKCSDNWIFRTPLYTVATSSKPKKRRKKAPHHGRPHSWMLAGYRTGWLSL